MYSLTSIMSPLFIEHLDIIIQNFETKFSSVKSPSLLSLSPLIMSLFVSKICSVSVIITSNMDEKSQMDNKFYG